MEDTEEEWKELLKHNMRLEDAFKRVAIGNELQMTTNIMEVMRVVSVAKSLSPGVSSFFLTQYFAMRGIDSTEDNKEIGFIGPSINALVNQITDGIANDGVFSPKITEANKVLLSTFVKTTVVSAIGAGKLLNLENEKKEKNGQSEKQKESNNLYGELLLLLMASSNFLKIAFKEALKACGADKKTEEIGSEILTLVAFLLTGVVSKGKTKNFTKIIELLNRYFASSLGKIEETMKRGIESGKIEGEKALKIQAALTQASFSLRSEEPQDFIKAVELALEASGVSKENLEKDILEIESVILNVYGMLTTGMKEFSKSITEVSVIA